MSPEEFEVYRPQLTRNVRTKIKLCDEPGCICGNECVVWTGALDSSGYASFKIRGVVTIVHRYIHEKMIGPIKLDCWLCGGTGAAAHNDDYDDVDARHHLLDCSDCGGSGLDPDPTVDHLCVGHRNCMTADHYEIVSRSENSTRANTRRHGGYSRKESK